MKVQITDSRQTIDELYFVLGSTNSCFRYAMPQSTALFGSVEEKNICKIVFNDVREFEYMVYMMKEFYNDFLVAEGAWVDEKNNIIRRLFGNEQN